MNIFLTVENGPTLGLPMEFERTVSEKKSGNNCQHLNRRSWEINTEPFMAIFGRDQEIETSTYGNILS